MVEAWASDLDPRGIAWRSNLSSSGNEGFLLYTLVDLTSPAGYGMMDMPLQQARRLINSVTIGERV